jgi:putative intracellular protease/amidase
MEKKRTCYLFVFDGYADWEPALAVSGLNKYSDFAIRTFAMDDKTVESMGNIRIQPDMDMREVTIDAMDILLLPGGEVWEEGGNLDISPLVESAIRNKATVAAICGATIVLARMGELNERNHTSNGKEYLPRLAPGYSGERFYKNIPCVRDENIITANGAGMIEFAYEIFSHISMMNEDQLKSWLHLYKSAGIIFKSPG